MVKADLGENKLRCGTAMFINIIESNEWQRPINFTSDSMIFTA